MKPDRDPSVEEWARTAPFSQPLRWGEVEAALLAREVPPLPEETLAVKAIQVAAWVGVALLLVLPTMGSSVLGLAAVVIGSTRDDVEVARDWLSVARFPFAIAIVVELALLLLWWELRRRSTVSLVVSGITVVASAAGYLVVDTVAEVSDVPWLSLLMIGAALGGVVVLVLGAVSRPEGRPKRRKPPRRGPRRGVKRARYERARDRLLEILLERKLVDLDESDRIRVSEMPLGYWSELDDLDQAEWRRVLELRLVGWRHFDDSDRHGP